MSRKTPLTLLVEANGTLSQVRFLLETKGECFDDYLEGDSRFRAACAKVLGALSPERPRALLDRDDLDRFLFADNDVVIVVGQDGLVANVAKYLRGQATIGFNSDPVRFDGVLCRNPPETASLVFEWLQTGGEGFVVEPRSMVQAEREDGQALLALNEVFVGHCSHQSARYRIRFDGREERQSSSGLIVASGTGCSGWARSIAEQRNIQRALPTPQSSELVWFVREPFPSKVTGTSLNFGTVPLGGSLEIVSEMAEGGVLFADGIEQDFVPFPSGAQAKIRVAPLALRLIVPSVS
ncbi:MAG: hypothetical protein U0X73_14285 [Thermoanaerobaculia bacterium]